MIVGIEQHLVRLQRIGPHDERPAVRQLEVRHLQLGALTADDRPVLAPVELEGLAWLEHQRHEGAAPAGLLLPLPIAFQARKGRDPVVGAVIAQLTRSACICLTVRFCLRDLPPRSAASRQLLGKRVQLARPVGNLELRLDRVRCADTCGSCCATIRSAAQISRIGIPLENASAGLRSIMPCRSLHVPPTAKPGAGSNMGHFSVEIYAPPGSTLSGNQHGA
jgi:hypothetical protein